MPRWWGRGESVAWSGGQGPGSCETAWAFWVGTLQVKEPHAGAAEILGRGSRRNVWAGCLWWGGRRPADRAKTEEGEVPDPERKPDQRP